MIRAGFARQGGAVNDRDSRGIAGGRAARNAVVTRVTFHHEDQLDRRSTHGGQFAGMVTRAAPGTCHRASAMALLRRVGIPSA
uniref:Uncharacterized protein n=1 Tax=Cereibacter sphaeroides (strain ATCC 17025 / ATH 2.4.3) TaxID=349102 RepID=A4WYE9_CERS5